MPIAKGFVTIKRANIPIDMKLSIGEHILEYFYSNYSSSNNPFNDLNISNIMIDIEKRIILLIDPYVPEIA
ncbi:hypothetical protein IPJ91_00010 [bacterium]|nr:MAG: hypothetical protein IPJ91_00010 [bacterium]